MKQHTAKQPLSVSTSGQVLGERDLELENPDRGVFQ